MDSINLEQSLESPLPTRTLRKGTRSCAECKRRKTRCFYDRPADATCVACQRRGKPCYGQEFMDVSILDLDGEQTIVERLRRAERILETISKDISSDRPGSGSRSPTSGSFFGGSSDVEINRDISDSDTGNTPDTDACSGINEAQDTEGHQYRKYAEACEHSFYFKIPYFGTIKITCDAQSDPPTHTIDVTALAFPSSNQYSSWSPNTMIPVQQNADSPHPLSHIPVQNGHASFLGDHGSSFQDILELDMPDLVASADNWVFQGVGSASFDALSGNPAQTDEAWAGYTLSI